MIAELVIVFPGQGTQFPGMGRPWRGHPAWPAVVEPAEAALEEDLGHLLLEADAEELSRTRNAQLAVLLSSLLAWEGLRDRIRPIGFAGHSLGQVTAMIAAGIIGFADGLRFAGSRADRTQAAADADPGAMAALIGASFEQAETACELAAGCCWIANDNAPGQLVLAGTPSGLAAGVAAAKASGVRTTRDLAVGGAFHTPLMEPAAAALAGGLAEVEMHDPTAPVVSNHDGRPHTDPAEWRDLAARHVSTPVQWRQSQLTLALLGAQTIVEVGPGGMLTGLAKRTVPDLARMAVATPDDLDALR